MSGKPEGYVDVAHRIAKFKEAHPDGSLVRDEWHVETVGDRTFVVYTAKAYRTPNDLRPGVGTAWEPFPGPTPFTKDSELMNAETAAWGRAIAALGFEVREGIATAQDMENRTGKAAQRSNGGDGDRRLTDAQLRQIKRLANDLKADPGDLQLLDAYAPAVLKAGRGNSASRTIDALKERGADALLELLKAASSWQSKQTDIPADKTGLDLSPVES